MQRRKFIEVTLGAVSSAALPLTALANAQLADGRTIRTDVVVTGGGLGGCAAALAASQMGLRVVLVEETDWIGGQLTSQGVPPDEHRWIESSGCTATYRKLRENIRDYYRNVYPLTERARENVRLNPGQGSVSRLCHEPKAALAVLEAMLAPHASSGRLRVLLQHKAIAADTDSNTVRSITCRSLRTGNQIVIEAPWYVDATEMGDLLPLTQTEFVSGSESKSETNELHADSRKRPTNHQAFTVCFAVDYRPNENHTIVKPAEYDFWQAFTPKLKPAWPGQLLDLTYTHPSTLKPKQLGFRPDGKPTPGQLNLFNYRRIAYRGNFKPGTYDSDISLINWPQNDYMLGNLFGVSDEERQKHIHRAKQLSLSLLYWLQTEAPRADGGTGWPGLRLRRDVMGTEDGLAKYPYVRESRRIRALTRIVEGHCGRSQLALESGKRPTEVTCHSYFDTVGVGSYQIDLHPSSGGDNYIDFASVPFEIPLGALIPQKTKNLIAGCKNIGSTHITNGCYRLHPVEWNIGEVAGRLAAHCKLNDISPHQLHSNRKMVADFQAALENQGVQLRWPK